MDSIPHRRRFAGCSVRSVKMKNSAPKVSVSVTLIDNPKITPGMVEEFKTATNGLSDAEIIRQVRFVEANDPQIPASNRLYIREVCERLKNLASHPYRIALWPDGVANVLVFERNRNHPKASQLLRAYRNARNIKLLVELHDAQTGGHAS